MIKMKADLTLQKRWKTPSYSQRYGLNNGISNLNSEGGPFEHYEKSNTRRENSETEVHFSSILHNLD